MITKFLNDAEDLLPRMIGDILFFVSQSKTNRDTSIIGEAKTLLKSIDALRAQIEAPADAIIPTSLNTNSTELQKIRSLMVDIELSSCEIDDEDICIDDIAPDRWCELKKIVETLAVSQKTEWQPISTAPKDKPILLGYFNKFGNWKTVRGEWHDYISDSWEDEVNGSAGWYEVSENADEECNVWSIKPTLWHPLPPLPQPPQAEG